MDVSLTSTDSYEKWEKKITFYKILKGSCSFVWTDDREKAFNKPKVALSQTRILVTPKEEETLFMYLNVMETVISAVICSLSNEKMLSVM